MSAPPSIKQNKAPAVASESANATQIPSKLPVTPAEAAPQSSASAASTDAPGLVSAPVPAQLPSGSSQVPHSAPAHAGQAAPQHVQPHGQHQQHAGYPPQQAGPHFNQTHNSHYQMHPQQHHTQQHAYQRHPQAQHAMRPPMAPQQGYGKQQYRPIPAQQIPMGMSQSGGQPQPMPAIAGPNAPQMYYPVPHPNMMAFYQHQQAEYMNQQFMYSQHQQQYNPQYMMQNGPPPPGPGGHRYPPQHTNVAGQQPPMTPKPVKPRVTITLKTPDGKGFTLPHQNPTPTHPHVHASSAAARTPSVAAPVKIEPPKSRVSVVLTNPNTGVSQVMRTHDDAAGPENKSPTQQSKVPEAKAAEPVVAEVKKAPIESTDKENVIPTPIAAAKPVETKMEVKKPAAAKPTTAPLAQKQIPPTKDEPKEGKKEVAKVADVSEPAKVEAVKADVKTAAPKADAPVAETKAEVAETEVKKDAKVDVKKDVKDIKKDVKPAVKKDVQVEPKPEIKVAKPEAKEAMGEVEETKPEMNDIKEVKPVAEEGKPEVKEIKGEAKDVKPEVPEVKPVLKETKPEIKDVKPEVKETKAEVKTSKPETKEVKSAPTAPVKAQKPVETKEPVKTEISEVKKTADVTAGPKETTPAPPATEKTSPDGVRKEAVLADKPTDAELEEGEIVDSDSSGTKVAADEIKPKPSEVSSKKQSLTTTETATKTAAPAKIDTSRPPAVMTRLQSFEGINYPSSVASPTREPGQPFQYQRDFLMQFANIIKDKPEGMASLDQIFDDRGTSPRSDGRGSKGPGSRPVSRQGSTSDVRGAPAPKTSEERFAQSMASKHSGMGVQGVMGVMSGVAAPPNSRMSRTPSSGRVMPSRQPSFRDQGPPQRDGRGSRGPRGGGMGRPGMGRADTVMDIDLPPVEPLVKSESAWGPGAFKKTLPKGTDPEEQEKIEEELIFRKIKGLLNKLTIEKFDAISDQILNIGMTRPSIVKGVIFQIFEKALDEPTFGSMYAQLCHKLFVELPTVQKWIHADQKDNIFRKLLLSRCQEEFERSAKWSASEELLTEQRREARTRLDTMSDEEKLKIAEEDYERQKLKRRVLGNIAFIGELFIKGLITDKVMHNHCITHLLRDIVHPDEEDIESLCKLLATIGSHLEHPKSVPVMNSYFERIQELSVNQTLSARIRFMLLDLIDMRKDNWKSRTEIAGPKTIAQIRMEAERKAAAEEAAIRERNSASSRSGGRGPTRDQQQFRDRRGGGRGSHDTRGSSGGVNQTTADGWTTQGGSSRGSTNALSRPGDMAQFGQIRKAGVGPITLGPGGSMGLSKGAQGWGKKKDGASAPVLNRSASSVGADSGNIAAANIFNVLSHDMDRKKSVDEGSRKPAASAPSAAAPAAKGAPSSGKKEFKGPELSKKFEGIVQEWQSLLDVNEVKLSLKELNASASHAEFVELLLNGTWDKKPDVVKKTRKLLVALLADDVVSRPDLKTALTTQLEMAEDVAIDVPTHYKDLALLLARFLSDGVLTLNEIQELSTPLIASRALRNPPALSILKEILADVLKCDGEDALVDFVSKTDLKLFFQEKKRDEPEAVSNWLKENDLPALLAGTPTSTTPTAPSPEAEQ
ncbi:hypothetical protein DFJ77DRAFT_112391 [Powellomyces hirtus]|nr:hypothetical protein DFJ77DRAFT_112391 [Powellomyces hirtus]